MTAAAAPFHGVRIVELAHAIAVPYATALLAALGADVVKIESSGDDTSRSQPGFVALNVGKRSVALDLGDPRIVRLAAAADVFVAGHIESDLRPHGLDAAALRAKNPQLIHISMPPFGNAGPLVGDPGSPNLVAAVGGIMSGQASSDGEPVAPVLPLASYGAGVLGATAAAAALVARARDGVGRALEVSELAGALALQVGTVTSELIPPSEALPPLLGPRGPSLGYAAYRAADDRWIFVACPTRPFFDRLLIALGLDEIAADPRLDAAPWGALAEEDQTELIARFEATFRARTRDDWLARFAAADVPAQPVLTRDEFLASEEGAATRLVLDLPDGGRVELSRTPVALDGERARPRRPAPGIGEHTAEVLSELEASPSPAPATAADLPDAGSLPPLLDGVAVLDVSSYIAGPAATRHLAMLGADVVKVEPLRGDPFRTLALGFQGWNLGKRAIALDLRRVEAREVLDRLLSRSAVVVDNYRPATAAALGLADHDLRRANAEIVHLSIGGLGDGDARDRPAFDPLAQALTGAMRAQGGAGEPVLLSVAIGDVMAALLGTLGVTAALAARALGQPDAPRRVETTLLDAALAAQAAEFVRFEGAPLPARGAPDRRGRSAAERIYRCGGGRHLYVEAVTDAQRDALVRLTGIVADPGDLAGPVDGPAAASLASAFARSPLSTWLERLRSAGVPAEEVTLRTQLLISDPVDSNHLVARVEHPVWRTVRAPGRLVADRSTRLGRPRRAPMLSEHAADILEDLGFDPRVDFGRLVEAGVLAVPRFDLPPPEHRDEVYRAGHLEDLGVQQLVYLSSLDVG